MNTAFVTFVYPSAKIFFKKFISSLKIQSDKDFHLVIFNDGCSEKDLILFNNISIDTIIVDNTTDSIAQSRMNAIKWLKNSEFDLIIFGDIDDEFACDRVEKCKQQLLAHPIIINEIILCDENNNIINANLVSSYLKQKKYINKSMIKECNLIGFSHLSIKKEMLNNLEDIRLNNNIKIVDWIIATYLLQKEKAYFFKDTFTKYIKHDNNIALNSFSNLEECLYILDVKIKHYSQVAMLDSWFKEEKERLLYLKNIILYNEKIAINYINFLKKQIENYYPWWNQFRNSKELEDAIYI